VELVPVKKICFEFYFCIRRSQITVKMVAVLTFAETVGWCVNGKRRS
jgi:hypothetical protein